jgi:hypothetical protein
MIEPNELARQLAMLLQDFDQRENASDAGAVETLVEIGDLVAANRYDIIDALLTYKGVKRNGQEHS